MISILIPVYNTARYVEQCVRSVTRQSERDIEIILVNDCSTDDSLARCRALAAADSRIQVIDLEENVGLARNRFVALEKARSEYVMFLDSDDWLQGSDTLSKMRQEADVTGADYVEVGSQRVIDSHGWIRRQAPMHVKGVVDAPRLFSDYYVSFFGWNRLSVNVWGKLYRRSTLEKADLKPWKYALGEDVYFNLQLFPHLKRISILDHVGHNYRYGGMTSRYNPRLFEALADLYTEKLALIERFGYHLADNFVRIELKNVLMTDICHAIRFIDDEARVRDLIQERLALPCWDDLRQIKDMPQVLESPLVQAVINRDADAVYAICRDRERAERPAYRRNKLIHSLLSRI